MKFLLTIWLLLGIATIIVLYFITLEKETKRVCDIVVTYLFYQPYDKDEFEWNKNNKNLLKITAYRKCPPPPELNSGILEVYRQAVLITETKGGTIKWEDSLSL